ncbi:MAG: MBL fold metallo-hydrolase [Chloroflexi bacterium]|nr:MBL fold metallo-hydrolase [Chloroflexota bacterium]
MIHPYRIWQDVYIIGSAEISHPYDCCIYLVDAGELVLIDAGAGKSFNRLVDNIFGLGFAPERLNSLIATHCHIDHIGALSQFRQEYGVKIIAHKLDAQAIESGVGVGAELYGVDYQTCRVETKLERAKHNLSFSKHELKTLHIPGHTRGSIVVYTDIAGKRVLFGQDIHGPYEVAWGGDPSQAITSLQKLIDLRADILCEGHFGIYQPASKVKRYIESYLYQLQQRTGQRR